MTEVFPRRFGGCLLTARLGEDALGRVYRGLRESGERTFVRLRILEGPEISEDAVLDAIQENGEIHSFLKNPAIARGVQMDSAEGVPFLAWNEENGRTLDELLVKARRTSEEIPVEHALLIAEKIATALDHAYNTSVDGDRTLHGLVWPGFVSLSDDGEIRLTGFGLAPGFLPSLGRPRFAAEVSPYLAPEQRAEGKVGRNSDVYSVGAILLELLTGRPPGESPSPSSVAGDSPPLPPEVGEILRMTLSGAEERYKSCGELRRDLGKLLFSGPYAASTFNLAYYLHSIFRTEIEEEGLARLAEAAMDPAVRQPETAPAVLAATVPPASALATQAWVSSPAAPLLARSPSPPHSRPEGQEARGTASSPAPIRSDSRVVSSREQIPARRSRAPLVTGGALLVAAAVALGFFVIARSPSGGSAVPGAAILVTALPLEDPTPAPFVSTAVMTEAQFQQEVSRRLDEELGKVQDALKAQQRSPTPLPATPFPAAIPEEGPLPALSEPAPSAAAAPAPTEEPTPAPTAVAVAPDPEPDTAPAPPVSAEVPSAEPPAPETAPSIKSLVKPLYPPIALQARIGGIVLLRVLVSEAGLPLEVEVLRGTKGGLTEAAVLAVRRWTFHPARRGAVPIRAWTTIPIPFKP